jgi:hypothetical protein
MSDASWFGIAVVAAFVLRGIAATIIFLWLLPQGIRCPICDRATLRVQSRGLNRMLPWFRTSWCPECRWEGLLRNESPARRGAAPPNARRSPPRRA